MVSSSTASSTRSQTPDDKHKLFFDYADKTQEALSTFTELKKCSYASKELGNSNSHDFIECDCYEEFQDGVNHACGEDSDCINRLTLIECVNDLCGSCGNDCRNQRFQKREYADIAVFQTQKKGYGVRAQKDIEAHEFIYEYIGEVIAEDEFRDRMIDYDHRGLKHFYFMMLQTGEFIDATVKGSLARFCNHSCNPNAYVNKWAVAGKLRMGIFANRKILKGEEITFDYNVDRYGATAQPCYCDEPNCLGFLGGKTQTDAASLLPQNYADALGVRPSIEKKWIKLMKANGEKILKSEVNNINVEFVKSLDLSPCESLDDVSKVMSVLLQADDNLIIRRLMERILLTKDQTMHYQIIKLHGYRCFNKLLGIFEDDSEIQLEILEYLNCLPKTTKNGIISSQIDKKVEELKEKPELTQVSDELLAKWRSFETYKRITKKDISESSHKKVDLRRLRLPPGWEIIHENGKPVYYNAQQQTKLHHPPNGVTKTFGGSQPSRPSTPLDSPSNGAISSKKRPLDAEEYEKKKKQRIEFQRKELERLKNEELQQLKDKLELEDQKKTELEKIIAEANQQKELEKQQKFKEQQEEEQKRQKKLQQSKGDYMLHKWNRFFAGFVPNLVRHYEKDLGKDHIKECARDIVKTLSSKELKKDPKKSPPPEPSKEKKAKVREFTKVYMEKFSQKYAQRKKK